MKIGILGFITESSVDTMTFGRKAKSLGFDTFYLPEHPIIPVVRKSAYPASADGVMRRVSRAGAFIGNRSTTIGFRRTSPGICSRQLKRSGSLKVEGTRLRAGAKTPATD